MLALVIVRVIVQNLYIQITINKWFTSSLILFCHKIIKQDCS